MIEVKVNTELAVTGAISFKRCLGLELINTKLLLLETELLISDLSARKVSVQVIDLSHKSKVKSFNLDASD